MLRRETIIALRARHTAFRIATDILYPQQPPPAGATVQPAIPFAEDGEDAIDIWQSAIRERAAYEQRRRRRGLIVMLAIMAALAAISVYVNHGGQLQDFAPPPPQARPILPAP